MKLSTITAALSLIIATTMVVTFPGFAGGTEGGRNGIPSTSSYSPTAAAAAIPFGLNTATLSSSSSSPLPKKEVDLASSSKISSGSVVGPPDSATVAYGDTDFPADDAVIIDAETDTDTTVFKTTTTDTKFMSASEKHTVTTIPVLDAAESSSGEFFAESTDTTTLSSTFDDSSGGFNTADETSNIISTADNTVPTGTFTTSSLDVVTESSSGESSCVEVKDTTFSSSSATVEFATGGKPSTSVFTATTSGDDKKFFQDATGSLVGEECDDSTTSSVGTPSTFAFSATTGVNVAESFSVPGNNPVGLTTGRSDWLEESKDEDILLASKSIKEEIGSVSYSSTMSLMDAVIQLWTSLTSPTTNTTTEETIKIGTISKIHLSDQFKKVIYFLFSFLMGCIVQWYSGIVHMIIHRCCSVYTSAKKRRIHKIKDKLYHTLSTHVAFTACFVRNQSEHNGLESVIPKWAILENNIRRRIIFLVKEMDLDFVYPWTNIEKVVSEKAIGILQDLHNHAVYKILKMHAIGPSSRGVEGTNDRHDGGGGVDGTGARQGDGGGVENTTGRHDNNGGVDDTSGHHGDVGGIEDTSGRDDDTNRQIEKIKLDLFLSLCIEIELGFPALRRSFDLTLWRRMETLRSNVDFWKSKLDDFMDNIDLSFVLPSTDIEQVVEMEANKFLFGSVIEVMQLYEFQHPTFHIKYYEDEDADGV